MITSPAFATEKAKLIFWDRFEHYARQYDFDPWVVSLLDNHYHILGYVKFGLKLKTFTQRLHGSVAKLVNDILSERRSDFFRDKRGKEYFDGCLRDEKQYRLAYRYTQMQAKRHGIMDDYLRYPHTRIHVPLEDGLERALKLNALLMKVPYKRYEG